MDFDTQRIIDSNGTKYRVGWNEHGWFTIQHIEMYPADEAINAKGAETIEYEGEEYCFDTVGEYPLTSFTPEGAEELVAAIEEGM